MNICIYYIFIEGSLDDEQDIEMGHNMKSSAPLATLALSPRHQVEVIEQHRRFLPRRRRSLLIKRNTFHFPRQPPQCRSRHLPLPPEDADKAFSSLCR